LTLLVLPVLTDIVTIDRLPTEDVAMEAIRWFDEIGLADVALVGGKGANLGELRTAGLPIPPGFVVTAPWQSAAPTISPRHRLHGHHGRS
jgi:hypothetical protein